MHNWIIKMGANGWRTPPTFCPGVPGSPWNHRGHLEDSSLAIRNTHGLGWSSKLIVSLKLQPLLEYFKRPSSCSTSPPFFTSYLLWPCLSYLIIQPRQPELPVFKSCFPLFLGLRAANRGQPQEGVCISSTNKVPLRGHWDVSFSVSLHSLGTLNCRTVPF